MKLQYLAFVLGVGMFSNAVQAGITLKTADGTSEQVQVALVGLQTKATVLGFAKNQYDLGMAYYEGKLVERDPKKAAEWLSKAAAKGYAPAMFIMGKMLWAGDGVKTDQKRAAELIAAAAHKNNKDALALIAEAEKQQKEFESFSEMDSHLLCKNWYRDEEDLEDQKAEFHSFYYHLADVYHKPISSENKALLATFNNIFKEGDVDEFYPEYKDVYDGDIPYIAVFIPRHSESTVVKRIDILNHYGYGMDYEATLTNNNDLDKIKNFIEYRDKFKFKLYDENAMKEFIRLGDTDSENYEHNLKLRSQNYFGLYLNEDDVKKIQKLYFYAAPLKNDPTTLRYVSIEKLKDNTVLLGCGEGQNY